MVHRKTRVYDDASLVPGREQVNAKRLVPLSGVPAVALIFASQIAAGSSPKADAPIDELVSFYGKHGSGQTVSGVLLSLGVLFFLIFSATVASVLRDAPGESAGSSALCLGGGVLLSVGLAIFAGLTFAIGDAGDQLDPSALQTLHVLSQELFYPVTVGISAFLLGAGTAVLKTAALPKWLGWLAVFLAVVAAIPSHVLGGALDHIGFFAFGGLGVWTLIVGVLLAIRTEAP